MNNLYRGCFNYARSVEVLYRHAATERQAWFRMCQALAKKHDVLPHAVMSLFDGSRQNYEINVEMEIKETEALNV